jgi:hypothetical protein
MKFSRIAAALVFLGFISSPSLAQLVLSLEQGHEAAPFMIRMPTSSQGELTLQICDKCKVLRLRATPETRYLIGAEAVSRADMTKYMAAHPSAPTVVVQRHNSPILNRVSISATASGK